MNHKSLEISEKGPWVSNSSFILSVCLWSAGTVENETLDIKAEESFFPSFKAVLLWQLSMLQGWYFCVSSVLIWAAEMI